MLKTPAPVRVDEQERDGDGGHWRHRVQRPSAGDL